MARIYNSRKALFQTPNSISADQDNSTIITGCALLSKLDIGEKALANVHAESEFVQSVNEAHKERMVKLKLLLNEIEEDNWKYDNVSKLIGI